jgi:hypothetical protein
MISAASIFFILATILLAARAAGSGMDFANADNVAGEGDDFEFFHVLPNNPMQKLNKGWQQPGLMRPKYIVTRRFSEQRCELVEGDNSRPKRSLFNSLFRRVPYGDSDVVPGFADKVRLRFMEDKSVLVYGRHRPWVSLAPFVDPRVSAAYTLASFLHNNQDQGRLNGMSEILDGAWDCRSAFDAGRPDLQFDIHQHASPNRRREHHFSTVSWDDSQVDDMAATIMPGRIFTYQLNSWRGMPVPAGYKQIGSFSVKFSPHRPMVSKEFQAFQ